MHNPVTAAIGVIGGADGPTAVFVTGLPGPGGLLLAAAVLAAAAAGVWALVRHRRNKK